MVPTFSCYPSGTTCILLRTKAICLKRMRRLTIISVNYMLGKRYISYAIIQERYVLFLVVEHNMLDACALALSAWYNPFSSWDSCMQYHTLVLTGDSSCISGSISSPFKCKERFCDSVSFARFKNVVCYFQTVSCLLSFKEGNKWISSAACLFSPLWKRTRSSQKNSPETFLS